MRAPWCLLPAHGSDCRWFRSRDANIFHCSQHTVNLPWRKPITATIVDCSCWITPECHTAENIAGTLRYGEKILKACDGLIAISTHARDAAGTVLGIPAERIRVIYPGVAEAFFQSTEEQARLKRSKYRLIKPYILFVGCSAFTRLREALLRDVNLVIAGPFGWGCSSYGCWNSGDYIRSCIVTGSCRRWRLDRQSGIRGRTHRCYGKNF